MSDNLILIDWFAMSFRKKGISPYEVIDFLKLKDGAQFQQFPGRYRYRDRLSFGNIHIYYNNMNPDADYPTIEMTGQGCREFETFSQLSFNDLFDYIRKDPVTYHMSRLDIAFDDFTGIFDMNKVVHDYRADNWVSHSCPGGFHGDLVRNEYGKLFEGLSIITGSKSSDVYMRIYDKAIERRITDGRHWIRCELVLKQERAETFIMTDLPIGEKFRGVIHNYFRFVTPSKKDTNKRRWLMRPYWQKFLEDAEKISTYTPKDIEYNLSHLHRFVFGQAASSIETYIKCVGLMSFLDTLLDHQKNKKLSPKQLHLIEECKMLCENNNNIDYEKVKNVLKEYEQ